MGSAQKRLDDLGELDFTGKIGQSIARYAKGQQEFAHDMAAELEIRGEVARAAMLKLRKHPRMRGLNVRLRALLVARHLFRGRNLAQGISAEMVRFNVLYRREFIEAPAENQHRQAKTGTKGEVDL